MTSERKDTWSAGEWYEPYVGRWSRLVASDFLAWLPVGPRRDWLDVGCGTGALSEMVLRGANPRSVKGLDPSAGFIEHARAHIRDPRASFDVADARALPLPDAQFDAAVSGLVLNFIPDPLLAVQEMMRVARSGGWVASYVWDYADKMELMRYFWEAAVALDPAAHALHEGRRFPLCRREPLRELFTRAGVRQVEVMPIDVPTRFADFDDYWAPFLGGQGPAPGYAMSLPEARRGELRDRIHSSLPFAADGSINLIARAWAVRGRVGHQA